MRKASAVRVETHHQLAREHLLVVTDELLERLEELHHAVVLLERRELLKRLLDQFPQLLRLDGVMESFVVKLRAAIDQTEVTSGSFTFLLFISSSGKKRSRPTSFLHLRSKV